MRSRTGTNKQVQNVYLACEYNYGEFDFFNIFICLVIIFSRSSWRVFFNIFSFFKLHF